MQAKPIGYSLVIPCFLLAGSGVLGYSFSMSTAEIIYDKAKRLPASAQEAILHVVEEMSHRYPEEPQTAAPLTLRESAELRGKLAAWEDDWNAPGMEAYDRP